MPRRPTTTRDSSRHQPSSSTSMAASSRHQPSSSTSMAASSRHQPSSSSTSTAAPAVVAPPGHSNRQPMALAAARMGKRAVAVTAPSANNAGPYAQRCSRPACGHPQPAAAPKKSSKLKRISAWLKGNKAQDQGRVPARKKHPRIPWLCRDGDVEETFSLIAETEERLCRDGEVEETFSLIAETEERLTHIETKIDEEADDDDAPAVHHTKEIQNTDDARRIVVFNDISAGSNQDKDMSTPMPDTRRDSAGSSTYFTPQSFSYSIELAQYWLEHIHMAESRGNHQLAATSFQSAFELNAEPIEIIRRELLAYTMRHEDAMHSAPLLRHLLATYCDIIVRQPTFGEGHKEQASTHKEAVWLVTWARKIGAWLRSGKRKIFA